MGGGIVVHGLEGYGLPENPAIPLAVTLWKQPVKWLGNLGILAGLAVAGLHFLRYGPKQLPEDTKAKPAGGVQ